jgi:hypothetical protein
MTTKATDRHATVRRILTVTTLAAAALVPIAGTASATPNSEASCVGLASVFFAGFQARDDVAHAIADRFGIPPGAEVSRFAHVRLGDTAACVANGQAGG